jgi:site-specific DNA recombinase
MLASQSSARAAVRNKNGCLLRGIQRCAACDCGMVHTYTSKGNRRYRYYICAKAQQHGWKTCPAPSLPAAEIERFVVDEIRCVGRDRALVAATVAETRRQRDEAIQRLKRERTALERQRRDDAVEIGRVGAADGQSGAKQAQVEERLSASFQRLAEIREELDDLTRSAPSDGEVAAVLAGFDGLWESLAPWEQAEAMCHLIGRVDFDAASGNVAITFNPTGLKTLEAAGKLEETAA